MPAPQYSPFDPEALKAAITKEERQLIANMHARPPELEKLQEQIRFHSAR